MESARLENHTPTACAARCREELGLDVVVLSEVFQVSHAYPDRIVELHFFTCEMPGEPIALLGQEMRWVSGDGLVDLEFPPADAELIALLRATR